MIKCEWCGTNVWVPKGDGVNLVCDCGRTQTLRDDLDRLRAIDVVKMPKRVRALVMKLMDRVFDLESCLGDIVGNDGSNGTYDAFKNNQAHEKATNLLKGN